VGKLLWHGYKSTITVIMTWDVFYLFLFICNIYIFYPKSLQLYRKLTFGRYQRESALNTTINDFRNFGRKWSIKQSTHSGSSLKHSQVDHFLFFSQSTANSSFLQTCWKRILDWSVRNIDFHHFFCVRYREHSLLRFFCHKKKSIQKLMFLFFLGPSYFVKQFVIFLQELPTRNPLDGWFYVIGLFFQSCVQTTASHYIFFSSIRCAIRVISPSLFFLFQTSPLASIWDEMKVSLFNRQKSALIHEVDCSGEIGINDASL
jgi:hypothetical protein